MLTHRIQNGDCRNELKTLGDCSVDSIVTDPPYELGFMGKGWDRSGIAYNVSVWSECLRVLKPGGHLLAFGGSRTYHRLACAIEDAGFEIRDQIQWIYGSGFPKSLDVGKAIDAAAGAVREVVGEKARGDVQAAKLSGVTMAAAEANRNNAAIFGYGIEKLTVPATDAAKQWNGWGTALKPAHEPIVLARKPLIGTVAENVLQHGTGGLNIDGCRTEGVPPSVPQPLFDSPTGQIYGFKTGEGRNGEMSQSTLGRWPANVIHDGSEEALAAFPDSESTQGKPRASATNGNFFNTQQVNCEYSDAGSAARFFYCAKASQEDREDGLDGLDRNDVGEYEGRNHSLNSKSRIENGIVTGPKADSSKARNHHPTVKPTDLMRYLCRLITPPGGTVLDPFCGSGSTGRAAILEQLNFIGIELDAEYCVLAEKRIEAVTRQGMLMFA